MVPLVPKAGAGSEQQVSESHDKPLYSPEDKWLTYHSTDHPGVTFKYPPEMEISDLTIYGPASVTIYGNDIRLRTSFDEFLKGVQNDPRFQKMEILTVNGLAVYQISLNKNQGAAFETDYYVYHNGSLLMFYPDFVLSFLTQSQRSEVYQMYENIVRSLRVDR
jgi:hypothetical protein